uniref:Uncharacterized protein n=1 Tax=Oryza meridionalis TaxID=40149 RepID=A0A0E0DYD6_9ORYZ
MVLARALVYSGNWRGEAAGGKEAVALTRRALVYRGNWQGEARVESLSTCPQCPGLGSAIFVSESANGVLRCLWARAKGGRK